MPAPAVDAVKLLQSVVQSNNNCDDQVAEMLVEFKKVHVHVRAERDVAQDELAKTKKAMTSLQAERDRLAQRNSELEHDLLMLSSAIDLANREITERDSSVLKMVTAIRSEFKNSPAPATAPAAPSSSTAPIQTRIVPEAPRAAPQQASQPVRPELVAKQMPSLAETKRDAEDLTRLPVAPLNRLGDTLKEIENIINQDGSGSRQ